MQCATLIVGIGGSMVVIATNSVDMVVVGVIGDAGAAMSSAMFCSPRRYVGDERRSKAQCRRLEQSEKPQKPTAQHSSSAPRNHLIGLFARISTAGGGHNRARSNRTAAS